MFYNSRLWPFTHGVRGRMAATVAVGVLSAGTGIARLALLGWLLAKVYAGEGLGSIAGPAALIAGLMLARGALEYWRAMLAHGTAAEVQLNVRRTIYDHLIALGPAYLTRERSGGITMTMAEGVEQLETYFGQYLPQLAVAALTPVLVFAVIAFIDLPVALTLFVFAMATLLAPTLFHQWDERNSQRRRHAYHDYGAEFMDAMQGLATLKAFGQSAARGRLLADKAREVTRSTMWVLATNLLTRGITDTGIAVGAAVALALGAYRVTHGQMSLEALLIILMMGIEVFRPQRDLRSLLHQGMVGRAAADGIFALLDAKPLVPAVSPGELDEIELSPTVRFDDVSFSYPSSDQGGHAATSSLKAHDHLSFEVRAGERVGFVGQSGCGKSTIVRLLLRQFDPNSGAVSIGGRNLRELPAEAIYSQLAVVGQDGFLFHGTVEENLRVGRPDASHEDIETAARNANALEFINDLPQGFATVIGERGIRLSGGQRQRLAIARALLSDAPILVLDEALSAVDAENEAVIAQALERLMTGRTTLIFAHRLSSVIRADRLLVMDNGAIVDSGDHKALMAKRGVYHRLMAAQAEDSRRHVAHDTLAEEAGLPEGGDASGVQARESANEAMPPDEILRAEGVGWIGAARALLRHAGPWTGKLSLTFVLGIVRVAALIGVGVVSALTVAAIKQGGDYGHWLVALAVLAPAAGILHWLESWLAHDLAFEMLAELRIKLFNKLEQLAPAFLVRRRSGDLVALATHDVELVEYFYAHTVTPALVAVLVPGIVIAVLLDAAWPLAAALAPFLVIVGVSPFALRKRVDLLGSKDREALGELNAHIADTVQGLGEILAFRNTRQRRASLVERARKHVSLRLAFFHDLTLQHAFLETATGLGGLAVVVVGASLAASGDVDAALLPLMTLLALSAFLPISEIAEVSRQLADTLGATRRLEGVWREQPVVTDGAGSLAAGDLPPRREGAALETPALEMIDVSFSYPGFDALALREVNLSVPRGDTVALVGTSGAGKTTIAHLFLRFWDPQDGMVRLHGQPLRDGRVDDVRANIALVGQDTYLFNQSLRDNIALARPDATEDEIRTAASRASLDEFIASLPHGLDTSVGERGAQLSGGQRQRVAIARAFLKDAPILVLDEATSSLDAVNEAAVRNALHELMHDRTTVVIAHRLSTVRDADRIYVLDRGRVVEHGTHESLLDAGGFYNRLVGRQLTAAAAE